MKNEWTNLSKVSSKSYVCGYCNNLVASSTGYKNVERRRKTTYGNDILFYGYIYTCPHCFKPTYFSFDEKEIIPSPKYGEEIKKLPEGILSLYNQARNTYSVNAFTGVALLCRKLIMNIAVENGCEEGKKFQFYVDFLDTENYIPKKSKSWVDKIRQYGNDATHKIEDTNQQIAKDLIDFSSMLLKVIYEYQN